jgi:hypothetical protein
MNLLILLIISLIVAGFALISLGIHFFLRRKQPLKDESYRHVSAESAIHNRCGCGRGNCCAIE